jgi:HPt (histidine-containing phosphotransfer) domain-containing protein
MDDEEFREITVDFIQRLESRIDEISQALASADYDSVRSDAHWLKGAGGTVGFSDFTEPARALEQAAKAGDAEQASQLLREIDDIRSRVVIPGFENVAQAEQSLAAHEAVPTDPLPEEPKPQSTIHCTLPLDDPEFYEIVSDFLCRFDVRLMEMKTLCDEGEFEQLAQAAHWLKGSGGTVGFAEFAEPAAALEAAAKCGAQHDAHQLLNAITEVRQRIVLPDSAST